MNPFTTTQISVQFKHFYVSAFIANIMSKIYICLIAIEVNYTYYYNYIMYLTYEHKYKECVQYFVLIK